jgi:phage replication O-like protein O
MKTQGYTKVSDVLIDSWLTDLTEAELKTLLIIIRQTTGWNKPRDRISHSQFIKKTGLSQRSITSAIESLSHRNFIYITNQWEQNSPHKSDDTVNTFTTHQQISQTQNLRSQTQNHPLFKGKIYL